jgi:DNA polymerase elongation subunit (family B)
MNRLIDSRNCYELIQRNFVIPASRNNYRYDSIRTLEEIVTKDKGGMIFSPRVGLHENVVVLDYENEYANLIIRHNLSYETVKSPNVDKGLLPLVLEKILNRKIYFKNLQSSFHVESKEWILCEQRIAALKGILVSIYGTTGSFWNRFANVATFEEINRISREVLIKTKDVVQRLGFELLYADTDSVFLKKDGAPVSDFEQVREVLAKETGLPISITYHYKFLVLLPLETDERIEALKHYFGITQNNELITRGIEIRRHDTPNFIKQFQHELLYVLFDCKNSEEIYSKGYEGALLVVTQTLDKIMTGEVELNDLIVSKLLGQGLEKYKALFPHVCAAIQMKNAGISLIRGDNVQYIYKDARNSDPLSRVIPVELIKGEEYSYDKEKYREMLLEAAETVLGYFGFDRNAYGDHISKRNRDWWRALLVERQRDIDNERT